MRRISKGVRVAARLPASGGLCVSSLSFPMQQKYLRFKPFASALLLFFCLIGAGCDSTEIPQPKTLTTPPAYIQKTTDEAKTFQQEKIAPVKTPIKQEEPAPIPSSAPNGTYTNTYGNEVPSPYAAPSQPAGASAQCRDGTYSFSQSRRGTCSHHGGVLEWY